ncbi:hypothetical protein Tco_1310232 [Tanacetum coccineum]
MQSTDVFQGPADQEFETGVQDEQAEEEVQHLPDWFNNHSLPSPDHAWISMFLRFHEAVTLTIALGALNWGKKRRQFYAFATSRESARDVYSKRRIIVVTKVEIVEWHDYKHLDWITVRRDDDDKVTNLRVEEPYLHLMSPYELFTRRVVHPERVEDLQLDVEAIRRTQPHKACSTRSQLLSDSCFILLLLQFKRILYENKDKKNRLNAH